jgi:hypothetical protein
MISLFYYKMEILHLKMAKDLVKMSLDYANETNGDVDSEWIQDRIQFHMNEHKMSFPELRNDESKCTARLWNLGKGEKQCTHKRVEGPYCDKHNRMLKLDGVLRFGDIRDKKPTHDLIKLKNGYSEKLNWTEPNPLQQLQNVLDQQSRKVILTTPRLLVN